jgi:small subunit ribosomal protein S10
MAKKNSKKNQGDKTYILIKLKAYDNKLLDSSTQQIVSSANRTGAKVSGPVPLPTHIEKICVNRSPHVDKKSRDQLEIRTHKRLLGIVDPTPETLDALMNLELSAGVNIEIEV